MLRHQRLEVLGNIAAGGRGGRAVDVRLENVGQLRDQGARDDVADFQQQRLLQLVQVEGFGGLHPQAYPRETLHVLARKEHERGAVEVTPDIGLNGHVLRLVIAHPVHDVVAHQQVDVWHFEQHPLLGDNGKRVGGAGQANVQNLADDIPL